MGHKLERRYGQRHLHFITCSCYRRLPFLRNARKRDLLLKILLSVREKYQFSLVGYVIMRDHIHLLISEPKIGSPSTVMQAFKQRVSRALRAKDRRRTSVNVKRGLVAAPQLWLWSGYRFYQYGERNVCPPDRQRSNRIEHRETIT
jgi:putative transposase